MTWFSTKAFQFDLPGDGWDELTIQSFHSQEDEHAAFAISRQKASEDVDLVESVKNTPAPYLEREIVRHEPRQVGALDAEDLAVIGRASTHADYHRMVVVRYYDLALSFQWSGAAANRDAVDARVEQALETVRFRSR